MFVYYEVIKEMFYGNVTVINILLKNIHNHTSFWKNNHVKCCFKNTAIQ